jgi:putative transposase
MKLTAKVKLLPTPEQRQFLLQTLETANAACDWMSARAWEKNTFGAFSLHKIVYAEARERFDLSAQMVVRLIAKVGDAYKLDKKSPTTAAS